MGPFYHWGEGKRNMLAEKNYGRAAKGATRPLAEEEMLGGAGSGGDTGVEGEGGVGSDADGVVGVVGDPEDGAVGDDSGT